MRCFHSRDPGVLTKAFVVYVRPTVEYCSPVWSPCTVLNINNIESVQRTFTKRLSGMRSLSYNGRVEFYLYPTVGTVLIHSIKPE